MFIALTDTVAVAGQIAPADLAAAAAAGFVQVVNNRPDDEEPDQPNGDAIHAAAVAAGMHYTALPVDHRGVTMDHIDAMAAVLAAATGPVLAFCRSGTRSANLWALTEAKRGGDADAIIAACAQGRFDVSGMRSALVSLKPA